MMKLKIILTLIVGIQISGYGQWEEKNITTTSTLNSVDFVNVDLGYVTGGNIIYKTENGGEDWTISHTASDLVFFEDIFVMDTDRIIAVGKDLDSNQSVITKTENGGDDWIDATISNTSFLRSVFFVSSEIGFCTGGGGAILKSTDSGDSWEELDSGIGSSLQSIFFVNEMVGIAVGGDPVSAIILKTEDGGENWEQINSSSNKNLQSVYFSNQETGYVVGWDGEIMKTDNCGGDWTIQTSVAMTGNLEVVFTDDNTGYIVGGTMNESLIQKTSNGGDLWEDISPPITEGLTCIQFPSFDVGYAVGSSGTVLKTESGGVMTSTQNFQFSNAFSVYPNPTSGFLNIESENNSRIQQLRVYDSNGRLIKVSNPTSTRSEIDFTNLESNVYYLEIHTDKNKEVRKIVKR